MAGVMDSGWSFSCDWNSLLARVTHSLWMLVYVPGLRWKQFQVWQHGKCGGVLFHLVVKQKRRLSNCYAGLCLHLDSWATDTARACWLSLMSIVCEGGSPCKGIFRNRPVLTMAHAGLWGNWHSDEWVLVPSPFLVIAVLYKVLHFPDNVIQ